MIGNRRSPRRLSDASLVSRTEIIEEMAEHVEQRYRTLLARGHGEESAYQEALDEVSNPAFAANLRRTMTPPRAEPSAPDTTYRGNMLASAVQDLVYAFRMFRKNPGFTAVALIALTLGIGANTAIFSVVNAVVLRPLPFGHPEQLVRIWESNPEGGWPTFSASHPNFLDWRARNTMFERLAAASRRGLLADDGRRCRDRARVRGDVGFPPGSGDLARTRAEFSSGGRPGLRRIHEWR